ncbi:tRNA lysidine(34) synthetase TilS [Pricia sp. S334]|uniref:tRNA(Ile)-lysidine synthase n=1 Tax=Pricia mediterranea TaxID=3076079 RepID=A0ABU3LA87_9FLAO|nr:tRNA lysidine(34) synthetase TilS [Pricia sp. S334]MDT7830478.1 tRNA lysidine(34) synthetase TilS [Pricia sp. S334]
MLEAFKTHIETNFPELRKSPFLLACSGGIDSMVLTELCASCGLDFSLAHCNFQLRGSESDADEKFVSDTAKRLDIKIFVTHFYTIDYAKEHKVSVQMAARELRYEWFAGIMRKNGIKTLVTAHHADDNLETFLINLSRGTGIEGLTGIPTKTNSIARPLIAFSREQIEAYAEAEQIQWREDSSNSDLTYLRNNIRHQILPLLKDLHPNFLNNFRNTQSYLSQTAAIADTHIRELRADVFEKKGHVTRIPVAALVHLKPLQGYLYGLFHTYGFKEWNDVENLLTSISGKEIRSKTHRLIKDRGVLLLTEIEPSIHPIPQLGQTGTAQNEKDYAGQRGTKYVGYLENGEIDRDRKNNLYHIHENQTYIERPIKMDITEVDAITDTGSHILYSPKSALKYPLSLRKWEKGDYFCPFGMKGSKKLSKFFKDEKMDRLAKESQWLLCSNGAIVWVVGKRADERFKVPENTEEIVKFKLKL